MIVYINGRFLADQKLTGVPRYAIGILNALDALIDAKEVKEEYQFVLLTPKNIQHILSFKHIRVKKVGCLKNNLWEQLELPLYSGDGILLNLCCKAPIFKLRQLLAIHDAGSVATPYYFQRKSRIFYRVIYSILGKSLPSIITVSNFSKEEIRRHYHISSAKIHVIYEGAEHMLRSKSDDNILTKYGLQKGQFVFGVGGTENKNYIKLVEALKDYKSKKIYVVIAGRIDERIKNRINSLAYVKCVGYVTDEELVALYQNAGCFVFPSLYEGFGIPPLEAMTYGCPVIVSNATSLPEICEDAALYCDPYDAEDIAEKVKLVLMNKEIAEAYRRKGYSQVKKFSWENSARELLDLIYKL